jgi:hypothetical protein
VKHSQYLDPILADAVHDDERSGGNDKLAAVGDTTCAAEERIIRQVASPVANSTDDAIGRARIFTSDVISDRFEIASPAESRRPSCRRGVFSRIPRDFFLGGKIPPLGRSNACLDLVDLPGLQVQEILDRLTDDVIARTLGASCKLV